ncbi:hypothetical protein Phum_PHUM173570 [Pediculus humanus corporis]|uniref:Uncharacterized protein n=1 Tax=Pediculus humanus subsp. corporis TaxID=121224 RepID=E0VG54_PEDHC|nr:uncharacterized protein Phum_PHUM173570 [Pediculus humanus corporis]EEB12360.1 hypothetical protein Phum_PHUM173570 [Pediculus humanus corporis]
MDSKTGCQIKRLLFSTLSMITPCHPPEKKNPQRISNSSEFSPKSIAKLLQKPSIMKLTGNQYTGIFNSDKISPSTIPENEIPLPSCSNSRKNIN